MYLNWKATSHFVQQNLLAFNVLYIVLPVFEIFLEVQQP